MISARKLLLTLACVTGMAGASQGAVIQYDYQGAPLTCGGNPESSDCNQSTPQPGFFGQIVIDTAVFGSKELASFSISADEPRRPTGPAFYAYRATSFDGTRIEGADLGAIEDIPFFVSFSGSIGLFLQPGAVGENSLVLGFDRSGEVTDWLGGDTDGGSTDAYISTEGDSTGGFGSTGGCDERNLCTFVPGTWTRTVLEADPVVPSVPAPVPLPAGVLLLGGALAALGARRCRRT